MNAAAVQQNWVGQIIDGKFALLEWIGGSGHSGVFRTELPGDAQRKAAIKLVAEEEGNAAARTAAWAAAAQFSHPHLMRLLASGRAEVDGTALAYSVTEFSDEVLADILPMRALTGDEVRELLGPVIDALNYLHTRGYIHGRLKPSNLLVVDDRLKLSVDSVQAIGAPADLLPMPTIQDAPELAEGTVSAAADVWSLGVAIVEALTQEPPVWEGTVGGKLAVPDGIPEPLAKIVHGCLEPDPANRWTLAQVEAELNPAAARAREHGKAEKHGEAEEKSSSTAERSVAVVSRPPRPKLAVIAASVVVLVTAVLLVWMRGHEPGMTQKGESTATTETAKRSNTPALAKPGAGTVKGQSTPMRRSAGTGGVLRSVQPEILPSAQQSISGAVNVRVRLTVNADGIVTSGAFESAGPSRYFAKVAMDAAQQWKFKPVQVNGRPAPSVWLLRFEFTRNGVNITPTQQVP